MANVGEPSRDKPSGSSGRARPNQPPPLPPASAEPHLHPVPPQRTKHKDCTVKDKPPEITLVHDRHIRTSGSQFYVDKDGGVVGDDNHPPLTLSSSTFFTCVDDQVKVTPGQAKKSLPPLTSASKSYLSPGGTSSLPNSCDSIQSLGTPESNDSVGPANDLSQSCPGVVKRSKTSSHVKPQITKRLSRSHESLTKPLKPSLKPKPSPRRSLFKESPMNSLENLQTKDKISAAVIKPRCAIKPETKPTSSNNPKSIGALRPPTNVKALANSFSKFDLPVQPKKNSAKTDGDRTMSDQGQKKKLPTPPSKPPPPVKPLNKRPIKSKNDNTDASHEPDKKSHVLQVKQPYTGKTPSGSKRFKDQLPAAIVKGPQDLKIASEAMQEEKQSLAVEKCLTGADNDSKSMLVDGSEETPTSPQPASVREATGEKPSKTSHPLTKKPVIPTRKTPNKSLNKCGNQKPLVPAKCATEKVHSATKPSVPGKMPVTPDKSSSIPDKSLSVPDKSPSVPDKSPSASGIVASLTKQFSGDTIDTEQVSSPVDTAKTVTDADKSLQESETVGKHKVKPPRPPPPSLTAVRQCSKKSRHPVISFTAEDLDVFQAKRSCEEDMSSGTIEVSTESKASDEKVKPKRTESAKRKRSRSTGFPFALINKIRGSPKPTVREKPEIIRVDIPPSLPSQSEALNKSAPSEDSVSLLGKNKDKEACGDDSSERSSSRGGSFMNPCNRDTIYPPGMKLQGFVSHLSVDEDVGESLSPTSPGSAHPYEAVEFPLKEKMIPVEEDENVNELDSPIPLDQTRGHEKLMRTNDVDIDNPVYPADSTKHVQKHSHSKRSRMKQKNIQSKMMLRIDSFDEDDTYANIIIDADDLELSDDEDESPYFDDESFTDDSDNGISKQGVYQVIDDSQLDEELSKEENDPMSRLKKITMELLTTERSYVAKLHLVDQVFHFEVIQANRQIHMFPNEVVPLMFSNIKSIYQFHHDFLLPQLEVRMTNWETEPRIGDVMKKFAPFLLLYTDYVKNFDQAMNQINLWMGKCPKFESIIAEIQKRPECGHLSLQHHMLGPVQRVPRYEMLLKDYLKRLPSDSPDRPDTEAALEIVKTAASHSNEAMQKIEKFRFLLEINEKLGGTVNVVSPTRELIKEGKIIKISARSGELMERHIYLFNDMMLVCATLPTAVISLRQTYRVKAKLDVDGMQVYEGDNLETPNTFYVKSKQKSIEFHTSSSEEKTEWQVLLWNIIADYAKKKKGTQDGVSVAAEFAKNELGTRAPTWVKDQETSMCMKCSTNFSAFKRRHHCRACGIVICAKCSNHKARLAYDNNKENRVCITCFTTIEGNKDTVTVDIKAPAPTQRSRGVLRVKAADPCIINGYLYMSTDKNKWNRRWFAIHKDFVLYSFKANQDVVAMTSMPLPGYIVKVVENVSADKEKAIEVMHSGETKFYYFYTEDSAVLKRWIDVLEKVVMLELPEAVSMTHPASATEPVSATSGDAASISSSSESINTSPNVQSDSENSTEAVSSPSEGGLLSEVMHKLGIGSPDQNTGVKVAGTDDTGVKEAGTDDTGGKEGGSEETEIGGQDTDGRETGGYEGDEEGGSDWSDDDDDDDDGDTKHLDKANDQYGSDVQMNVKDKRQSEC